MTKLYDHRSWPTHKHKARNRRRNHAAGSTNFNTRPAPNNRWLIAALADLMRHRTHTTN